MLATERGITVTSLVIHWQNKRLSGRTGEEVMTFIQK